MMKRLTVLMVFIIILGCLNVYPEAKDIEPPKLMNTHYALLMDLNSGRVLYEKDSRRMVPMASTTKIMTAIVALENSSLSDVVTVSKRASSIGGSTVGLRNGEKITMEQLLYGLMLESGNDCAIAIAEHIGGSVEKFAYIMDSKAFDLGAFDTHFVNSHGLDKAGHFTTAFDLALITRYAMQNDTFRKIVRTRSIKIEGGDRARAFNNINKMLWSLESADGVKTGTTGRAGKCLVSSSTSGGRTVICVTLNSPNRWEDSKNLLKYGIDNYKYAVQLNPDDWAGYTVVSNGVKSKLKTGIKSNIIVPVSEEEAKSISIMPLFFENLKAPIKEGQQTGELIVYSAGKQIYSTPMVSLENIARIKDKKDRNVRIFKK